MLVESLRDQLSANKRLAVPSLQMYLLNISIKRKAATRPVADHVIVNHKSSRFVSYTKPPTCGRLGKISSLIGCPVSLSST